MTMGDIAGSEKMKRVNFDLPEALHTKLKMHAAAQGKSIKDIMTDFVEALP
jgi:plasmid stability protein